MVDQHQVRQELTARVVGDEVHRPGRVPGEGGPEFGAVVGDDALTLLPVPG